MILLGWIKTTDGIECLITPQIERPIYKNRRCGDDLIHRIAGDNFKFTSRLYNGDNTIARCEINKSVRIDRRGAMSVPMCPFTIELFTGIGIKTYQITVLPTEIN